MKMKRKKGLIFILFLSVFLLAGCSGSSTSSSSSKYGLDDYYEDLKEKKNLSPTEKEHLNKLKYRDAAQKLESNGY